MKKFYSRLLLLICGIVQLSVSASAQCPISTSSSLLLTNDTTLPCGATCTTLSVLSANTTLRSTNTYAVTSIPYAPDPFGTGTTVLGSVDDVYTGLIPMTFNFCFFGTSHNQLLIGSNGNVCFNTGLAGSGDPWSISGPLPGSNCSATENAIMGSWMDYETLAGGSILYNVYGTAPCRRFVVSYNATGYFDAFDCPGYNGTQQMVMYESTNIVDIYTHNKPVCTAWNSGLAVTGIENAAGTLFYTAPGENGTTFAPTDEGWRFSPNGTPTWAYTWYSSLTPLTPIGSGLTVSVCPTVTTTYYVKAVATANCDSVVLWDSVKVTIVPPGSPILGVTAMCQGSTTTLMDSIANGTWTSSAPGVASVSVIDSTTAHWTAVTAGTATISYTTPGGCTLTQVVTTNVLGPVVGPTSVCVGNTIPLSNIAGGATWTSSNVTVATINSTTGVLSGLVPGTTTVVCTTPAGCISSAIITVNPNPVAIGGPLVVCAASTIHLTDSTAGGTWISGNTGVATINSSSGILTGVAAGVVTVTYKLPTSCFTTTEVTVNPLPATIIGASRVCAGFSVTLGDATSDGVWSSSHPTIASIDSFTGIINGITAGSVTITYTLPTGCLRTAPFTVYPIPAPPTTTNLDYCQHTTTSVPALTATMASGGTPLWYTDLTGGSPIPDPVPVLVPGVYTWYVSQVVNQCESSTRTPIQVTVHSQAVPPYIAPAEPYDCQYDTIGLYYTEDAFAGETFQWTAPFYASVHGGSLNGPAVTLEFDTSYNHNLVTLTTSDGYTPCNLTDTFDVPVKIAPVAMFYAKPDICVGDTVSVALSYVNSAVADYTWDFGLDAGIVSASSDHGGPYLMSWQTPGIHIITMTAYNGAACPPFIFKDTINVHSSPDASIAPITTLSSDGHICMGDSVLFSPLNYRAQDSYAWAPQHFFNQNDGSSIYGRVEIPGFVTLTVTDPFGCVATDSVYIAAQSCCTLVFPSAFTPNGDTKNDVFRPITVGHHSIHSFRVVNRWGQPVFEGNNDRSSWDGTYNGVPQDMGVYYYFIKYDCNGNTVEEKGEVTLVR